MLTLNGLQIVIKIQKYSIIVRNSYNVSRKSQTIDSDICLSEALFNIIK